MDGHVARLDCTLRVAGASTSTTGLVDRLKHLIQDQVIERYAAALDDVLEGDPHVYVLREVDAPITLQVGAAIASGADPDLAEQWGARLAGSVVRAIERGDRHCVVFDDQADYVAAFVTDLVRGT